MNHAPDLQVVLTIALLFWRNLFTVGKNVTKHFLPEFSGGLSVEDMVLELLDEALLNRGFLYTVGLRIDQLANFLSTNS